MKLDLYVGNLPHELTEDELRALFAAEGRTVEKCTIRKKAKTGRSRGFGFIKMGSEEDAVSAVAAINGSTVNGREIKVSEAFKDGTEVVKVSYEDLGRQQRPKRRR